MNKMFLFLGIIILVAIAGIMLLNKSTSSKSPLTANVDINASPTFAAVTSGKTNASPSVSATGNTSPSTTVTPSSQPTAQQNLTATKAVIKTSKGDISLQLYPDVAPKTVANLVQKAQSNFYTNLTFHRVEDWVIQGGDPKGNGTGGNDMVTETSSKPFVTGSLGVAGHQGEAGIISNDAQFFITKKDSSFLNGQYTNFGIVTNGMDVINKIQIGDKILGVTVE